MAVRVRFAPSPTGFLHLGGLRTALFNYLFARKTGGQCILRIEDTDQQRLVPGAIAALQRDLRWAGINFDEQPQSETEASDPYIQSHRLPLYRQRTQQLLDSGHAYRCFCSRQRLETLRATAAQAGRSTAYDRFCRTLSASTIDGYMAEQRPFTVRLAVPEGQTEVTDLIYGHISYDNAAIDDQVLMKADGYPTYHLANVVDDHDMRISHVLRGEEWLVSTAKHILLYKALGLSPPQFAHLPLLVGADRRKLSKRDGAVFVSQYREQGILPSALVNFVALLGWSPQHDTAQNGQTLSPSAASGGNADISIFLTMEELIEKFDLSGLQKAAAVVDWRKLQYINAQHLHRLPADAPALQVMHDHLKNYVAGLPTEKFDGSAEVLWSATYLQRVLALCRPTYTSVAEICQHAHCFFAPVDFDQPAVKELVKTAVLPELLPALSALSEAMKGPGNLGPAELKTLIQTESRKASVAYGKVLRALRAILTGEKSGPDLVQLVEVLGADRVARRIESYLREHHK